MFKLESFHLRKMTLNDYNMVFELWVNAEGMGLRVWMIQKKVSVLS